MAKIKIVSSSEKTENKIKNKKTKLIISVFCLVIFIINQLWIVDNYIEQNVLESRYSYHLFTCIIFWGLSLLLFRIWNPDKIILSEIRFQIPVIIVTPLIILYIEEIGWNPQVGELRFKYLGVNYLIILFLYIFFSILMHSLKRGAITLSILYWAVGLGNYNVLIYKGCPPIINDILAIGTFSTVAEQYKIVMHNGIIISEVMLLYWLVVLLSVKDNILENKKYSLKILFCGIGVVLLFFVGLYNFSISRDGSYTINTWSTVSSFYQMGAPLTVWVSIESYVVKAPDGYRIDYVEDLLSQESDMTNVEIPNDVSVIAIMNESFADLSVLKEIDVEEYLPYWKARNDYLMKGYVYTSAFGGGTCNSEFEFLTGNSIANFDIGVYPYTTYELSHTHSMAKEFANHGYETVALHPYYADNWNRTKVYEQLGFQDYISIEDMDAMEDIETISWAASDRYDYQYIIDIFENKKNPLFLFNVTMQNHGGYNGELSKDVGRLNVGKELQRYSDLINYLTLIKESDIAFEELLKYFQNQSEPVIVCMFGDHQPKFGEEISTVLEDNISRKENFMTPYMIWANFDLNIEKIEMDSSVNYLGAHLLHLAGIDTDYTNYLLRLEDKIPIVSMDYYQTQDLEWFSTNQSCKELEDYKKVQYYQLFEKNR